MPDSFDAQSDISRMHTRRYEFAMNYADSSKDVIDVACGEGYGSAMLAQKAHSVIGIDIDRDAVNFASQKYALPNLKFKQGGASSLEVPSNSADVIVSFETIEHMSRGDQEYFVREADRVLKKDGILIVSTPDKDIYGEGHNEFHKREMDKREFSTLLSNCFDVIFYGQDVRSYRSPSFLALKRAVMLLKKLDLLRIRKILPMALKNRMNSSMDKKAFVQEGDDIFKPVEVGANETAQYLIAICRKK